MTTQDIANFLQFLEVQGNSATSDPQLTQVPEQETAMSFMDFLTKSLISEGVLDTIRDQGFFGRIGANVLGELTNPLGIASTALLATGVGAPLGAGLKAATAGTRIARLGEFGARALEPVAISARGLRPAQILARPGVLGRSLAAENAITALGIGGGGVAGEVGQLIPGPTRSAPGQLALQVAGGVLGAGAAANSINRVLDPNVSRLASIARPNNLDNEIEGLSNLRKAFEQVSEENIKISGEDTVRLRTEQAEGAVRAEEDAIARGFTDPGDLFAARRRGMSGARLNRAQFDPVATVRPSQANPNQVVFDGVTEAGQNLGITRDTFTQVQNRINDVYAQNVFDAGNANDAFIKMMLGEVPTTGELNLLRPIIGDAFVDQVKTVARSTRGKRAVKEILEFGGIPRSIAGSFDMSSVMRQGGPLNVAHPRLAVKAWREGVKAIRDREYALKLNREHLSHKDYLMVNTGVNPQDRMYLHSIEAPTIGQRDEMVMSKNISEMVGVRHSEQFFATDLNVMRMGMLEKRVAEARRLEPDFFTNPKKAERAHAWKVQNNRIINSLTGRGSLGFLESPTGNKAGQIEFIRDALSASVWSPRLFVSRFQSVLEALKALRGLRSTDPQIRALSRDIAKDVAIYAGGVTGAISALSLMPGVSVETNPKSSDFGKVRLGNTRIDPWAGFQQVGRYATQFITGQRKSAATGDIYPVKRDEVLGQFLRSKIAPGLPALTASDLPKDLLLPNLTGGGTNFIGEPITGGNVTPGAGIRFLSGEAFGAPGVGELPAELNALIDQMVPLLAQDIAEAMETGGYIPGTVAGTGSLFGLGSTSFNDNSKVTFTREAQAERANRSDRARNVANAAFR